MNFLKSTIALLVLCGIPVLLMGQEDTVSRRDRYMPTGVRVGVDALAIGRGFITDSFQGWEINADVDFYRYFLAMEYGSWSRSYAGEAINYENQGQYWRTGVDVNFLTKDADRNMFFVGLRYARSNFDETFRVIDKDENWGTNDRFNNPYVNASVPARWLELTSGIKVKMVSWFWMGYTARFKFAMKTGTTPEMLPHDIPGYGKTNKETTWGFNYYLMFRLPIRAYPPLPPTKKKK